MSEKKKEMIHECITTLNYFITTREFAKDSEYAHKVLRRVIKKLERIAE